MKKIIAMVIAFQDFRDEEYFIPKSILEAGGAEVKTASVKKGKAIGIFGGTATVDLLIEDVKTEDFDAVIFVGGGGMAKHLEHQPMHQLARQAIEQGKLLAAICIAPALLAKAGVLKGKKATVWSNPMDKSAVKILKQAGAQYVAEPLVVDGKLITADGPQSARKFGETILRALGV